MQQLYRYYDATESERIIKLNIYDIHRCISEMEEYILVYPNDYAFQATYCAQLVTINKLDEAGRCMQYLQDKAYNDQSFLKLSNKVAQFKYNAFYAKLKIYMYKKEYKKADLLLQRNKNYRKDMEWPTVMCKVKQGYKIPNIDRKKDSYVLKQIIDYSEEDFIKKMSLHIDDGNNIGKKFYKNFPFERAYEEIKKNPGNRLNSGFIDNISYYRYDNCGYVEGIKTNYFKAITLHKTNNYILMYPTIEGEFMDYIDLNHIPPKKKAKIYIAENKHNYL